MQTPFKKILVFQDGYENSAKALELASKLSAADVNINVVDVQPPLSAFWHDLFEEDFDETPAYHRHKSLSELVKGIDFGESSVTTSVQTGRPIVKLVQSVVSGEHDLLIKEASSKATDFLFGSLDMRLIRHCPVPVWIVNPKSKQPLHRVLVAINPETTDDEQKLNHELVRYASAIANIFDCKLFVVAAYQVPVKVFGHAVQADTIRRYEKYEKEYGRKCRENLSRFLSESERPVKPENVTFECGISDEVILSAVEEIRPSLLVLGSIARQGVSGLLIGNTAERVLRQVDCSVFTLKPHGFVSPIVEES